MKLRLRVCRSTGADTSLNGITSRFDTLEIADTIAEDPQPNSPEVRLVRTPSGNIQIFPADALARSKDGRYVHGGNYAVATDDRVDAKIADLAGKIVYAAFPVFDRFEAW